MGLPILFELNQELTRLFVAGSRLSADDPRVKKFAAPLRKLGEKAPVFLKLAQNVEELLVAQPAESAQKLIETEAFLLAVLATQGETATSAPLCDIEPEQDSSGFGATNTPYRTLSPVLEALRKSGGGRMNVIKSALERGIFNDPRTLGPVADALDDKYGEFTDFLLRDILPSISEPVIPFLLDRYCMEGTGADGRRLKAIHIIKGEKALPMVEESFEKGSAAVKIEAIKIMAGYQRYEPLLLGSFGEKKAVREEVMKALVQMDSHAGVEEIMALYGQKPAAVSEIISCGSGPYLAEKALEIALKRYEAIKQDDVTADSAIGLAEVLELLRNKPVEPVAAFLRTALSEDWLEKAEATVPKERKHAVNYKKMQDAALQILYRSGKGHDFIWNMFLQSREGLLDKLFKKGKKSWPEMLPCYAFAIGASRLDPEKFYDVFFKTHLYKDIIKFDRQAFSRVFLPVGEGRPVFSKKIARYFLDMEDYSMAVLTVYADDSGVLDALAERLKNNLEKNTYGYINYNILKRLGETGYKRYNKLYELYLEKGRGSSAEKEILEQFLK